MYLQYLLMYLYFYVLLTDKIHFFFKDINFCISNNLITLLILQRLYKDSKFKYK